MNLVPWRAIVALAMVAVVGASSGCATVEVPRASFDNPRDPWQNWNRKVFSFNETLDFYVLVPVATTYETITPGFVRLGVKNFFNNFADAWSAVNNVLQGKLVPALTDVARVGTNTVLGMGGLFDVASETGLEPSYEDFGQTLGRWGAPPGPYVVWPLFGPSNVRESFALPLDRGISPSLLINDVAVQWGLSALQIVNVRAGLLGAGRVLEGAALDKYSFVRDAYLQRRRSLVFDGDPPDEPEPQEPKQIDTQDPAPAPARK